MKEDSAMISHVDQNPIYSLKIPPIIGAKKEPKALKELKRPDAWSEI